MMFSPDYPHAFVCPSPNYDVRGEVTYILLHYTGMVEGALERLCDLNAKVSAHYLVDKAGRVTQMVQEKHRAWHAGISYWKGARDLNALSIGIEIENMGHEHGYHDYPDMQIMAVIKLCEDIQTRHKIEDILAHSDVAPTRKQDPGEKFPWEKFNVPLSAPIKQGISYRLGDEGPPIQGLQLLFSRFGYDLPLTGVYDAQTKSVITAFQRHYRREKVDGIADSSTIETLRHLTSRIK
jgi:N-acetylmuramoyl-L-alanine amidase